jgi:gamma-glutamylcyclotransferase (GGCT)/AIG2-like uncharacterized protein YtfP
MSHILMTYGTLQRGQRNHWRLEGSRFISKASVAGQLWQFPFFNFPILKRHPNPLFRVQGELYEVSPEVISINDVMEEWYKRVRTMATPDSGLETLCWVYEGLDVLPLGLARRLQSGRWPEARR